MLIINIIYVQNEPFTLTKDVSFSSRGRLLERCITGQIMKIGDCSQPKWKHLQCSLYTKGSGKSWTMGQKDWPIEITGNVHL